ncbi:hypothetical protein ARALYDRAFT_909886 [Arabidopsis lyrata subsp. lyrata]|uniref:DUF3444 domain-containing protein n=1 Tax=Arabidopsis lyrata subsp. lyrata TaxID=81972 RepID=D7LYG2_ARALL|nr:uncharacterized protein LOC9307899 [Arabidopsis lyrata subsp. lyrata]EFH48089.1 hypothetical protein ARALYDRAFT_909886 [Arabidopsis lyrata subsp. lyrata]|eukprot:XP_002871830.1 uncharacterized protein LOC9307899 [Arabidopsis lyrata subsp. lyrata]
MMDITIDELHREKDASETLTTAHFQAPSSDRPMFWTICPFCTVRYRSYKSLLNRPSRCQSCYINFFGNQVPVQGPTPGEKTSQTTLPTMEKTAVSQNHVIRSNLANSTPKNQLQPQKARPQTVPFRSCPSFWTMCPFCANKYRFLRKYINKWLNCQKCKKKFHAVEVNFSLLQPKTVPSKNPGTHLSREESSPGLSCGEKRQRNEYGEISNTANCSNSEDVIVNLSKNGSRRVLADNGDAGEDSGSRKQLHEVDLFKETLPNVMNRNGQLNKKQYAQVGAAMGIAQNIEADKNSGFCDTSSEVVVQPKTSECAGPMFNDSRSDLLVLTPKNQHEKAQAFSLQQQNKVPSKNPGTHFFGNESSPGLSFAVKVGEKRKRNEYGENCNTENHSKLEDVIGSAVHNTRRGTNDNENAGRLEASGWGKQLHEVDRSDETLPNVIKTNKKLNKNQYASGSSGLCDPGSGKNRDTNFFGKVSSPDLCCAMNVDEKTKWDEYCEDFNTENWSKAEDVIVNLSKDGNGRLSDDNGDAGEESGSGKQLHEVYLCKETLPNAMNKNGRLSMKQDAQVGAATGISLNLEAAKNSGFCDKSSEVVVQPTTSECAGLKINDFDKLREEVKFAVGQAWALYDTDGMPRLYALIRKVSSPCFRLRITYLEPVPGNEKEIQWFEENLPVSVGNFRLGKNLNTKDRSIFSHHIACREGSTGHIAVIPRKGETWALFKNWDINWSSEPDSHRKSEYEFVEILSDYADGAGVSVAFLRKAKGFASVFFRLGTSNADISQILPHSLYRFSHRIPSFNLTGIAGKGMPKDAYELDQALLPETIDEIIVPPHLLAEPKPEALYFPRDGKVFQTGQIWSFYYGNVNLPLYYCRIQRITLTQAFEQEAEFKLSVSRLKTNPFPENVIQWEDKRMPVGCGTFSVRKCFEVLTPDDVLHQIVSQTSMDGNDYTILPKIGDVWAIYRFWTCHKEFKDIGSCSYDIVEVLDDTVDYKVLALEAAMFSNEEEDINTFFRAAESRHPDCDNEDGSEVIFTIPKSKMLRFSHQIPASRVTKEIDGDKKEFYEVDPKALPTNVRLKDH